MSMFHRTDNLTDTQALDWIAEILRRPEWDSETLYELTRVVEFTGRDISVFEDDEDSEEDD